MHLLNFKITYINITIFYIIDNKSKNMLFKNVDKILKIIYNKFNRGDDYGS